MDGKRSLSKVITLSAILLFLIFIPFFLFSNHKHSSELLSKVIYEGSIRRTDFVDDSGKITYATDKGYATLLETYDEGHLVLEQYLDEKGEAVIISEGYSIVSREYDNGLNTIISYLDGNYKPISTTKGYDSIHRTYYPSGKADTDIYFINGVQTKRSSGYWQYKRLYEDDKLVEVRYLNREGMLSSETTFGYAMLRRCYIETGREDYYFDSNEQPTSASLGQFGIRVEDGTTIYLDAYGNPMNTKKGYAIVKKEGNKTLYYNKDGLPVAIGHNQYGTEIINGQEIYLDKNGEPMMRLDNLLNTSSILVAIVAVSLMMLAIFLKGRGKVAFIVLYVLCIVYMTMWNRRNGDSRGEFEFFWSYKQMFSNLSLGQAVINNIWLFVPFGAAVYEPDRRWRWLFCIALSFCVEAAQYITGLGLAEFDDVISNGLGSLIGYSTAKEIKGWRETWQKRSLKNIHENIDGLNNI